ncbi:MAG: peroxide stress protein YaaA [Acidimicrobiia bacterium]
MLVLLPPSEGKAAGGDAPPWEVDLGAFAALAPERARVVNALRRHRGGTARMLGARGDLLTRARAANRELVGAPTRPAWTRFSGVVWEHLDPPTLGARARRRARRQVVVVNALTGLAAWDDPVPDFRLKLSASVPPLGNLASFWRPRLSQLLNDRLAGHVVVDLLPAEHRGAWSPTPDRYRLVRPRLVHPGGKPAGHAGKAAKGLLARGLLESDDVDATLAAFDPGDLLLEW